MHYKKLTIIGTSHIAKQSLNEIELAFQQKNPDIVAVELDRRRLHALLTEEKSKVSMSEIGRIG
ncbi:TraB family protein, partial [Candidatus Woesearchaeota archaeon]|nr:TraB family protein [Candidatus Woesearchaeota archaeon]